MKRALGLIEVFGLVTAVTVADDMVKCANVELIGYELARGSGMATVKIEGDVGAVQAAISCGETTAKAMNMFVGKKVIARPADGLEILINNSLTVGCTDTDKKNEEEIEEDPISEVKPAEKPAQNKIQASSAKSSPKPASKSVSKQAEKPTPKPAPEPVSKPAPKTAPKPEPKPVSKPVPEPVSKPVSKQATKPENTANKIALEINEDKNEK